MSRLVSKHSQSAYDSSSPSSSPTPSTKHLNHPDRDNSSDSFSLILPSDSPTNPFGRLTYLKPRCLPHPTPISEHLILRFRLDGQPHDVHRVVSAPLNYTFWHLSRLTQFLFNWPDVRTERNPHNKYEKVKRRAEHVFIIQKRAVVNSNASRNPGLIKAGDTVALIAGNIEHIKKNFDVGCPWEREERYTLQHLWHRPGSSSEMTRAIIYNYDVLSPDRKEIVHITVYGDAAKLKERLPDSEEPSNLPNVLLGQGLPDDEDDEDFALDLQQWNESHAFESYIRSQQEEDDEDDEERSPSPSHLAQEQARVKRQMLVPLPKHLPVDDESETEGRKDEHRCPSVPLPNKKPTDNAAEEARAPVKGRLSFHGPRLPDPEESREVGVYYGGVGKRAIKKTAGIKRSFAAYDEESHEVGADVAARPGARSRDAGAPAPESIPAEGRCLSPIKGRRDVEATPECKDDRGEGYVNHVDRVDDHATEAEELENVCKSASDPEFSPQKSKRPRMHAPFYEPDIEPDAHSEHNFDGSDSLETVVASSSPSRGIPPPDSDATKCDDEEADEKTLGEGDDKITLVRVTEPYKPAKVGKAAKREIFQKVKDHCRPPLLDTVVQQKEAFIEQYFDESDGEACDAF